MYQAIEKAAQKFKALQDKSTETTLDKESVEMLCAALSESAQELSQEAQKSTSQLDSANLAKLYQGILAAKRIIENLSQEGRITKLQELTRQSIEDTAAGLAS